MFDINFNDPTTKFYLFIGLALLLCYYLYYVQPNNSRTRQRGGANGDENITDTDAPADINPADTVDFSEPDEPPEGDLGPELVPDVDFSSDVPSDSALINQGTSDPTEPPMITAPSEADVDMTQMTMDEGDILATPESRQSPDPVQQLGRQPGFCSSSSDCNIVFGRGKNKCVDGACECMQGTGTFCHLRPNYYKDPKEMTPAQIIKFKKMAKLEKMTIKDYTNWLDLFRHDQENLEKRHHENFRRMQQGQQIYDIPLEDPVAEFFATKAAKRQKVCLDIPNAEIDSPLNWKFTTRYNNAGNMNVRGETNRPLSWGTHYKQEGGQPWTRDNNITTKDWFMHNVNWVFYDMDRNAKWRVQDPNQNRFMNIVEGDRVVPKPEYQVQRLRQDAQARGSKQAPSPAPESAPLPASDFSI